MPTESVISDKNSGMFPYPKIVTALFKLGYPAESGEEPASLFKPTVSMKVQSMIHLGFTLMFQFGYCHVKML